MKWINHQIVTGFIVCTATDDALFTASSIVGAVVPLIGAVQICLRNCKRTTEEY